MTLNVANCSRCGKVYMKNNYGMCGSCLKEIDQQYEKCLKFLRENRSCSINELSEATKVPNLLITQFIKEGRISIKSNPNMHYACEICGNPIRENLMCEPCRSKLAKETTNMYFDEAKKNVLNEEKKSSSYIIKDRFRDRR